MKKVIISPFSQTLRNGKENPKNFPHWPELIKLMKASGIYVIQIGAPKDYRLDNTDEFKQGLKFQQLRDLVNETDGWISVDSFLQHLCAYYKCKPGIVLWSQSDPRIFGYNQNLNILKDRKYLREKQYWLWEQAVYDPDAYLTAPEVFKSVCDFLKLI